MKYFIDTEFIEGFNKSIFSKRRHFIDLISIGIVAEDGREYYAISNEYNYNDADKWVKDNVILPLYKETVHGDARNQFDVHNFHKHFGKPNKQIAEDVKIFVANRGDNKTHIDVLENEYLRNNPEFYGYYADYDWVVFCSLFGRMIDLPKGFPMYCNDLKQMLDEKSDNYDSHFSNGNESLDTKISWVKNMDGYPKQENEHNALADARWNLNLYEFLKILK